LVAALFGIEPDETPVIRYFLTTAASFRRFMARERSQFQRELVVAALQLPLTQYVWVIEVATAEQWAKNHVKFRAVLDATASFADNNPLFLLHNEKKVVVIHRTGGANPQELDFVEAPKAPFSRMPGTPEQN
jgi:hypothetical protein